MNGADADGSMGMPTVAERTAATTHSLSQRGRHRCERRVTPQRGGALPSPHLIAVEEADAPSVGVHQAVLLPSRRIRLHPKAVRRLEHQRRDRDLRCRASRGACTSDVPGAAAHPEKICRRIGWSQLRKLGRTMLDATAHDPPRSTL